MRGEDKQQHDLFSYGSLEDRVPQDHPLRPIRTMVDEALKSLSSTFDELYGSDHEADQRKSNTNPNNPQPILLSVGGPDSEQGERRTTHQRPPESEDRLHKQEYGLLVHFNLPV